MAGVMDGWSLERGRRSGERVLRSGAGLYSRAAGRWGSENPRGDLGGAGRALGSPAPVGTPAPRRAVARGRPSRFVVSVSVMDD